MVIEETSDELSAALIAAPATRAFLRTDGRGALLFSSGLEARAAAQLAERVDLAVAAAAALGSAAHLGAPSTLVLEFGEALLLAGVHVWGEHVVVVGESGVNVGLVLSRLRRLLARDVHERENRQ